MHIAIIGSTGYIGNHVTLHLSKNGNTITEITRDILYDDNKLVKALKNVSSVAIFTGFPIIKSWNQKNKAKMYHSRVSVINRVIELSEKNNLHFDSFITSSATGLYDEINFNNEETNYKDKGFLTDLIRDWENYNVDKIAKRKIILRMGIVLGNNNPYVKKFRFFWNSGIVPLFRYGNSNFSVILINDLCRIVEFCINKNEIQGVVNTVCPEVNKEIRLHKLMGAKIVVAVPDFMAKLILGQASKLMLNMPRVVPEKLIGQGFVFHYPDMVSIRNFLR